MVKGWEVGGRTNKEGERNGERKDQHRDCALTMFTGEVAGRKGGRGRERGATVEKVELNITTRLRTSRINDCVGGVSKVSYKESIRRCRGVEFRGTVSTATQCDRLTMSVCSRASWCVVVGHGMQYSTTNFKKKGRHLPREREREKKGLLQHAKASQGTRGSHANV